MLTEYQAFMREQLGGGVLRGKSHEERMRLFAAAAARWKVRQHKTADVSEYWGGSVYELMRDNMDEFLDAVYAKHVAHISPAALDLLQNAFGYAPPNALTAAWRSPLTASHSALFANRVRGDKRTWRPREITPQLRARRAAEEEKLYRKLRRFLRAHALEHVMDAELRVNTPQWLHRFNSDADRAPRVTQYPLDAARMEVNTGSRLNTANVTRLGVGPYGKSRSVRDEVQQWVRFLRSRDPPLSLGALLPKIKMLRIE